MPRSDSATSPQHDPAIAFVRACIRQAGGNQAFAARHGIALRTVERMWSGKQPCPNRLRDELEATYHG